MCSFMAASPFLYNSAFYSSLWCLPIGVSSIVNLKIVCKILKKTAMMAHAAIINIIGMKQMLNDIPSTNPSIAHTILAPKFVTFGFLNAIQAPATGQKNTRKNGKITKKPTKPITNNTACLMNYLAFPQVSPGMWSPRAMWSPGLTVASIKGTPHPVPSLKWR